MNTKTVFNRGPDLERLSHSIRLLASRPAIAGCIQVNGGALASGSLNAELHGTYVPHSNCFRLHIHQKV